jgi:hypothetical protein
MLADGKLYNVLRYLISQITISSKFCSEPPSGVGMIGPRARRWLDERKGERERVSALEDAVVIVKRLREGLQ